MLDRPCPMTVAVSVFTGSTCSLNQGTRVSYLMPGGAPSVCVIGCSSALPGYLLPPLPFSFRRLIELKGPVIDFSGRAVGGNDDSSCGSLRVDKLQRAGDCPVPEEALAVTDDEGEKPQPKLVDEAVREQRLDQVAAAVHLDLWAVLLL